MAPLPKRRHSSRRQAKRTRSLNRPDVGLIVCKQCGKLRQTHRVCQSCGYYDSKPVVIKKEKESKEKNLNRQ